MSESQVHQVPLLPEVLHIIRRSNEVLEIVINQSHPSCPTIRIISEGYELLVPSQSSNLLWTKIGSQSHGTTLPG